MPSFVGVKPWKMVVRLAVLAVLLGIPHPEPAQAQAERPILNVLLIGNSQLWGNNIGDVLAGIAAADPTGPIIVPTLTNERGSAEHFGSGQRWDYVIYQVLALFPGNFEPDHVNIWPLPEREFRIGSAEQFYERARRFDAEAKAHGARTILFPSPPRRLARFDTDQLPVWKEVMDAHITIARELGADVAPIQEAFEETRQRLIGLDTYMYDMSHTSPAGAYLEGLVLYSMIADRDPTGAPTLIYGRPIRYLPGPNEINHDLRVPLVELMPATALELQRIAWYVTSRRERTAAR